MKASNQPSLWKFGGLTPLRLGKQVWKDIGEDEVSVRSAALAYYFVLAIFLGRLARFLILSLLTIKYGKQVVQVVATLFRTHLHWVLGIPGAALGVWLVLHLRARRKKAKNV